MLDKRYDHLAVEEGRYEKWVEKGYFTGGKDKSKPPFSLVIPPPNVTGKLHLGHAMDTIPDDIVARYKRMKGYDVVWVPGVDHAGIATQAKVEARLREQGISRYDLGREKFLEVAYKWKEEYAATIHKQWASLGLSVDYTRERFTLDEGLSKAVKKVFVTLYNEGLIYRGERIINWDPELRTALSNIEVVHTDDEGEFFYFRYPVEGMEPLIVATTRPETMFGDAAVFVNPKDPRYKDYIGKACVNPANGEKLPIMGDRYVDISFGTGAMKCTPSHDPNDFNLAKKYGLPFKTILDETAHMTPDCGKYAGMDRYECRKALVEDIKEKGLLVKIEKIVHSVGHSERSGAVVEPMLSKQWFVKMRPLAEAVLKMMESKDKIHFHPTRFEKVLVRWMKEADDWCVSRQLWWGHRIPAYYNKETGEVLVSETAPDMDKYVQDEDVLDTWFSSGLWPFATLGWPDKTPDFDRYFPTSLLVTGYDIIFFWVSRMVFQSLHFTRKIPFKDVLIHGLVRDPKGRKMSKSAGNGVDPMDIIAKYGVDALRYYITTSSAPGLDMRYNEEKIAAARSYLNKIWNAARYVEMTLGDDFKPEPLSRRGLGVLERSILSKLARLIKRVENKMERYEFGAASSDLYSFVYDDFCGDFLEMTKVSLASGGEGAAKTKNVLCHVLMDIVKMIYPYAPFVSEEIYLSLPGHLESLNVETYPELPRSYVDYRSEKEAKVLKEMIRDIRNYKSKEGLEPNAKVRLYVAPSFPFKGMDAYLSRFAFASYIGEGAPEKKATSFAYEGGYELYVEEDIDPTVLKSKLEGEKERLLKEVERGKKMLSNPGFLAKAPKEKVALEEEKLADNERKLELVENRLASL